MLKVLSITIVVTLIVQDVASDFIQECLDAHNSKRALIGQGVPPLAWDPQLEQTARAWANFATVFGPSPPNDPSFRTLGAGENGALTAGYPTCAWAVDLWYSEIAGYNYADPGASQGVSKHYTQVVWKGTTHVGCAVSPPGQVVPGMTALYCQYLPGGNVKAEPEDLYKYYKLNVFPPSH